MNDTKISLSIALQGGVIDSQSTQLKTVEKTKVITLKNGKKVKKTFKEEVEDWANMDVHSFSYKDPKTKKVEVIHYATNKCIPAKQHLSISKEAYDAMIDPNACPEWEKTFMWKKMSKTQRLNSHMNRIAESLNGKVIEYHIFED